MTRLRPLAILTAMLLATGCSTPSADAEHVVFKIVTGVSEGGPATTIDVVDLGLPLLHNQSGHAVRLRRVRLGRQPAAVQVLDVTAYKYSQVHFGISAGLGDFLRYCRKQMTPYPVSDVLTAPHSDSDWMVIIALTIRKPGRYHFGRVKIGYSADGQTGWQYQYLSTTVTVHDPSPGARPVLTGC